jgi:glycosyltransferase involved in cell wall biosynthesis
MQKTAFLTDFPPIQNGGIATHSIAWTMAAVLARDLTFVLTRKYYRAVSLQPLREFLGDKLIVYPDCSFLGLRRVSEGLRGLLDAAVFLIIWPHLLRKLQRAGVTQIIALCGNHWSFLLILWLIKQSGSFRLSIYMVDDLAASSEMRGRKASAWLAEKMEGYILPKMDVVYAISKGYAEHLRNKYDLHNCSFLPVPVRNSTIVKHERRKADPNCRTIAFSGSLNELYREPLRELHQTIKGLNRDQGRSAYRLRFFVVRKPQCILDIFEDEEAMEFVEGLPNEKLLHALTDSWANFLPYSFSENLRAMVSTAFSCKIAEYLAAGRPIMVYGPAYASVPQHFIENNIPLVETNKGKVAKLIHEVEQHNHAGLIDMYQKMLDQYHSPEALRRNLGFAKRACTDF